MKKRIKHILIDQGMSLKEFAKVLLLSYSHVRGSLAVKKEGKDKDPNWVRAFVIGYDMGEKSASKKSGIIEEKVKKIEATPMDKEMPSWKKKLQKK